MFWNKQRTIEDAGNRSLAVALERKEHELERLYFASGESVDLNRIRELIWQEHGLVSNTWRQRLWPKLLGVHDAMIQNQNFNSRSQEFYHPNPGDVQEIKHAVKRVASALKRKRKKKPKKRLLQDQETQTEDANDCSFSSIISVDDDDDIYKQQPGEGEKRDASAPALPSTSSSANNKEEEDTTKSDSTRRKSVTFRDPLDDQPISPAISLETSTQRHPSFVPLQTKEERQILRKIMIHLYRCHYPHNLVVTDNNYTDMGDLVQAVIVLWNALQAPSMTSLALNQLIPHYWKPLLQSSSTSKSDAAVVAETILHSVFCQWDDELYQQLILQDNSKSATTSPKDYALTKTIMNQWIPYWFAIHNNGNNNNMLPWWGQDESENDLSLLLRLWDVFVASPWYCPIYFSIAVLVENREMILAQRSTSALMDNHHRLEKESPGDASNSYDWQDLPNMVIFKDGTKLESVLKRCNEGMKRYPVIKNNDDDNGASSAFRRSNHHPTWLLADTAPTDESVAKTLQKIRKEQQLQSSTNDDTVLQAATTTIRDRGLPLEEDDGDSSEPKERQSIASAVKQDLQAIALSSVFQKRNKNKRAAKKSKWSWLPPVAILAVIYSPILLLQLLSLTQEQSPSSSSQLPPGLIPLKYAVCSVWSGIGMNNNESSASLSSWPFFNSTTKLCAVKPEEERSVSSNTVSMEATREILAEHESHTTRELLVDNTISQSAQYGQPSGQEDATAQLEEDDIVSEAASFDQTESEGDTLSKMEKSPSVEDDSSNDKEGDELSATSELPRSDSVGLGDLESIQHAGQLGAQLGAQPSASPTATEDGNIIEMESDIETDQREEPYVHDDGDNIEMKNAVTPDQREVPVETVDREGHHDGNIEAQSLGEPDRISDAQVDQEGGSPDVTIKMSSILEHEVVKARSASSDLGAEERDNDDSIDMGAGLESEAVSGESWSGQDEERSSDDFDEADPLLESGRTLESADEQDQRVGSQGPSDSIEKDSVVEPDRYQGGGLDADSVEIGSTPEAEQVMVPVESIKDLQEDEHDRTGNSKMEQSEPEKVGSVSSSGERSAREEGETDSLEDPEQRGVLFASSDSQEEKPGEHDETNASIMPPSEDVSEQAVRGSAEPHRMASSLLRSATGAHDSHDAPENGVGGEASHAAGESVDLVATKTEIETILRANQETMEALDKTWKRLSTKFENADEPRRKPRRVGDVLISFHSKQIVENLDNDEDRALLVRAGDQIRKLWRSRRFGR